MRSLTRPISDDWSSLTDVSILRPEPMRSNAFHMRLLLSIVLTAAIAGMSASAHARQSTDQGHHIPGSVGLTEEELDNSVPPARPEDVASPKAIVRAIT